ncbi:hypothetical protein R6Q59_033631 [Mikania micrantha]
MFIGKGGMESGGFMVYTTKFQSFRNCGDTMSATQFSKTKQIKIMEAMLLVTSWCIWRARNNRVFKGTNPEIHQIIEETKILSFLWITNRGKMKGV